MIITLLIFFKQFLKKTRYANGVTTMERLKKSRQREAIVDFLKTRKDHPTADTIYTNVKKVIPNISLGTVYRNLALLTERGEILKLSYDDTSDRYDANTHPHLHFQCRCCGSVSDLDIDDEFLHSLDDTVNKQFDGTIEGHSIYFFGTCPTCSCFEKSL